MITECNHSNEKLCGSCIAKNYGGSFLREVEEERDQLRAEVERLRKLLAFYQDLVNKYEGDE